MEKIDETVRAINNLRNDEYVYSSVLVETGDINSKGQRIGSPQTFKLPIADLKELAAAQGKWVPIRSEDDLPRESGEYIWQRKDGRLGSGHFHPAIHKGEIIDQCLAWHPLPAPYEPKEKI